MVGKSWQTALIAAILSVSLGLAGCAQDGEGIGKTEVGTVVGAAGGGLLGSQIGGGTGQLIATAAGTAAGAVIGYQIGQSLDRADRLAAAEATHDALENEPTGETVEWENPDTGAEGQTTPTRTFERDGRPCREFTTEIQVGGQTEEGVGTACRKPDGSWEIVETE